MIDECHPNLNPRNWIKSLPLWCNIERQLYKNKPRGPSREGAHEVELQLTLIYLALRH